MLNVMICHYWCRYQMNSREIVLLFVLFFSSTRDSSNIHATIFDCLLFSWIFRSWIILTHRCALLVNSYDHLWISSSSSSHHWCVLNTSLLLVFLEYEQTSCIESHLIFCIISLDVFIRLCIYMVMYSSFLSLLHFDRRHLSQFDRSKHRIKSRSNSFSLLFAVIFFYSRILLIIWCKSCSL